MIISIASGKGGTGKTTLSTSLALSLEKNIQFLDCDVEEPNAHIFLKPELEQDQPVSIPVPKVDNSKCNYCGKCAEVCAFNAIAVVKDKVLIFSELCHGCGGCSLLCPQDAISEVGEEIGLLSIGKVQNLQFISGKLNIGRAMSPPLIRAVKKYIDHTKDVIIDVPPGTSCPVIEAVKGSDFCILVTEPTPFGLGDLILAVEVLRKLKLPFGVVINRAGIGDGGVEQFCQEQNIQILMQIPFDKEIAFAYSKGLPIIEVKPEYKEKFVELFENIKAII